MKKIFIFTACFIIGILSSVYSFADNEIRFTLSSEKPENNSAEVVLVCDRNPGISEGEFNILYNSSIISLSGFKFEIDGFSTEEYADEGRINVKFSKKDNDLSAGGKICSLYYDIKNSDEKLAGVNIEFVSLKDNNGSELSRLVESCEISIPDGIENNTDKNSDSNSETYESNTESETDETNNDSENTDSSNTKDAEDEENAEDAISNSYEEENDTAETVLLIIGGIMIVAGAGVLFVNVRAKSKKQR